MYILFYFFIPNLIYSISQLPSTLTREGRPSTSLENTKDRSSTLMSLWNLGNPKNACHIQNSYDTKISKVIFGSQAWPMYWPFCLFGQFFHFQCVQPMLPSILGNPWCWLTTNNLAMSLSFSDLKYSSKHIETTALTN